MLGARGRAARFHPAREGKGFGRFREMARAERASGEIDDRRQVDVDSSTVERLAGRPPCGERVVGALQRRSGDPGRQLVQGACAAAFLVDEDKRAAWARLAAAPALDDHARDGLRRRQAGDDDERGLLARCESRDLARLGQSPAQGEGGNGLKQRGETHGT